MKLIIDIPEEMYNNICWGVNADIGSLTDKCIANGTPLEQTGHWIMNRQLERRTCDNCNTEYRWSFYPHNYCPNCGACMKDGRTLDEFIEDNKESEG